MGLEDLGMLDSQGRQTQLLDEGVVLEGLWS
jgi:hypothetical protein